MGETTEMSPRVLSFETWKREKRLFDYDVLDKDYLKRLKFNPELVPCACGCGKMRLRFDVNGIERRYIRGHSSRGRKPSAETLQKRRETRHKNQESSEKRRLMRKHGKLFKNLEKIFKNEGDMINE